VIPNKDKPPFLSKWKIRKRKELEDPLVKIRNKTRRKTNDLIKEGKLRKKPCVVCSGKEVIPHHEDYNNPFKVIWLCEEHHKDYHEGRIALFNSKLRWDPKRLNQIKGKYNYPFKKYQLIEKIYSKTNKVKPNNAPEA